jgi:hypothetical protein
MTTERIVRVNGNIHLNHIAVKHGDIEKVRKKLNDKLPKGLYAAILQNENLYASTSSVIISIYGEYEDPVSLTKLQQWVDSVVNDLVAPVESAVFDVRIEDRTGVAKQEQHLFAFSLEDAKIHHIKKFK